MPDSLAVAAPAPLSELPGMTAPSLQGRIAAMGHQYGPALAQIYVASGDPDGDAVRTSFSTLADDIRRRASALAALGIERADRVSLMTPPDPAGMATLLATMVAATAAPLNYFLEAGPIVRLIQAAGAKALLVARRFDDDPAAADKLRAIRAALPRLRVIAYGEGPAIDGTDDLDAARAREAGAGWHERHRVVAPDRVAAVLHTGGTTGRPKLVPHTEAMVLATVDKSAPAVGTTAGNVMLAGLPLFHTSGAYQTGIVPLLNGCATLHPSSAGFRNPSVVPNYWNFVARFGVTIGASVPTILAALTHVPPARDVSTLRYLLCGAAPLPRATIDAIGALTGGAGVIEAWGMTETCGLSISNPPGRTRLGSVGVPIDGVEAQIRAPGVESAPLPADAIGELVVRGDLVITRYLDDQPDAFTHDGWLRTGDLARRDADGYVFIVGRAKDIIIRSGHNIDPAVIEAAAYAHPAVQLAAAVGRPDRLAGELPVLFVQLHAAAAVSPADLLAFVAARIEERAAVPKAVHVVPAIPLSGPGKIHKVPLREEAIRAVMQGDIDAALASTAHGVTASIVDDERAGLAVRLQGDAEACARAAGALAGYPFKIILEQPA